MPLTVDWSITINGQNYTDRFNPYVHEIEVTDGEGVEGDTCRITLADDGRIIMPKPGAEIAVDILGISVFRGVLKTPRITDSKGGGMLMMLNATGHDTEGPGNESVHFAKEDCTLGEYLTAYGKKQGFSVKIDPELAKIKQPWWGSEGRSFLHELWRYGGTYGASPKASGKKAVLAKRGQGKAPNGQSLPTIQATKPGNIINADMEPNDASEVYRDVRFTYFDRKAATFKEEKSDVRLGPINSRAVAGRARRKASSKDDASDRAKGRANKAERDKGGGSVEIDIEPRARAEGTCVLSGVRQGIDGAYRIESVTHTLTAGDGGGATTKLTLKQPGDEAGSDSRKAGD